MDRTCQTPGTWYEVRINGAFVGVSAKLPHALNLTQEQAAHLEGELHDALERVLAPYFGS